MSAMNETRPQHYVSPSDAAPAPAPAARLSEEAVIEALRTVFDPEIPVNIYELGLIYDVSVGPGGGVEIRMTLTTPHCPAAASLPAEVEQKVRALPGAGEVKVDVVWDPPWSKDMMTEAARLELGFF